MTATRAARSWDDTTAGRVIIMVSSSVAAVLVIAGLVYAAGTGPRHQAALAAAGCEPNLSPSGLQCTTVQQLTSRYTAIMTPLSEQLNADAAAYSANEARHLAAAETALTAEVTSEDAFGTGLAAIDFPPAAAPAAQALARANQVCVKLTAEQARSSSLSQLRSFDHQIQVAGATAQSDRQLVLEALEAPRATPSPR